MKGILHADEDAAVALALVELPESSATRALFRAGVKGIPYTGDPAVMRALEALEAIEGRPIPAPTEEQLDLCRRALAAMEARRDEPAEEWAERLARDAMIADAHRHDEPEWPGPWENGRPVPEQPGRLLHHHAVGPRNAHRICRGRP